MSSRLFETNECKFQHEMYHNLIPKVRKTHFFSVCANLHPIYVQLVSNSELHLSLHLNSKVMPALKVSGSNTRYLIVFVSDSKFFLASLASSMTVGFCVYHICDYNNRRTGAVLCGWRSPGGLWEGLEFCPLIIFCLPRPKVSIFTVVYLPSRLG